MARPRSDDARRVMVAFRATEEQVARWRAAAGGTCTLSDFVRSAADRDAAWAEDAAAAYCERVARTVIAPDEPPQDPGKCPNCQQVGPAHYFWRGGRTPPEAPTFTCSPAAPVVPIEDRADALRRGDLSALVDPAPFSILDAIDEAMRSGDQWRPVTPTEPLPGREVCLRLVFDERSLQFVGKLHGSAASRFPGDPRVQAFWMPIV